jgi:hypothetical protein
LINCQILQFHKVIKYQIVILMNKQLGTVKIVILIALSLNINLIQLQGQNRI